MIRKARFWAVVGVGGALGLGAIGSPRVVGQGDEPYPAPAPVPRDLNQLAHQMAEDVRHLGEDIASDLGDSPRGRHLQTDTRELAQAADEFHGALHDRTDRFQAMQAYAGIDATWHHLANQFAQPGSTSPAISRAVQRVGRTDEMIHRSLGMNEAPQGYYGGNQAPTGMAEVQRLAHALVDRAEALASVVRADMVGPGGGRVVQDAVNLAQASDAFHDAIDRNGQIGAARNGYGPVAALSDRFEADLTRTRPTPRVQGAWQAFRSTEALLRQSVGLQNEPGDVAGTVLAPPPQQGPAPVVALSDQLVQQSTEFVQIFSQTAGAVPEGGQFLADAQTLQAAVANFRQDVARGLNPGQLAFEFRDVDAIWLRMARRTNRIARGRSGPNIRQIGLMGQTVSEIHRLLGIPGYAPAFAPIP